MTPDAEEAVRAARRRRACLLDLVTVRALVGGASTSTIYADATFPLPVVLSHRRVRWLKHEVVAWMRARSPRATLLPSRRRKELPSGVSGAAPSSG